VCVFFFILICEAIGTVATPGLLCQPRVIVKMIVVEKQMECRLAGETEVFRENLPQRHFCPSQNPTWPDPVLNQGRRGGKPATNRVSYGVAKYWVTKISTSVTFSHIIKTPNSITLVQHVISSLISREYLKFGLKFKAQVTNSYITGCCMLHVSTVNAISHVILCTCSNLLLWHYCCIMINVFMGTLCFICLCRVYYVYIWYYYFTFNYDRFYIQQVV
jgi:hypothetical protein